MILNSSKVDLDAFVISTPNLVKVTLGPKVFKVSIRLYCLKNCFFSCSFFILQHMENLYNLTIILVDIILPASLKLRG